MRKPWSSIRSRYQRWQSRRPITSGADAVMSDAQLERLQHAQTLHQAGQLDEAEAIYRELLLQYPHGFDLLLLLGALQGQRGKYDEAGRWIEKALAVNPDSAAAHSNLGNCRKCTGQFEAALASYDASLRLEKTAGTYCNRAGTLIDLARYDDALECFNQALVLVPNHVMALDGRGVALAHLGRYEEALASHQEATALDPNYSQAWCNSARVAVALKRFDNALASYDQALALHPGDAANHNNRGAVLADLRRYEDALASIQHAIALAPNYIDAFLNLGATQKLLKRHDEALRSYDEILKIAPGHVAARIHRGTSLIELGRREEALTEFDIVLDAHRDNVDALTCRGGQLHALGRDDEGLECLHRAIAIKPDAADAIYNCGIIHMDMGRHDKALEYFERSSAIKPTPASLSNRGVTLVDLRRHEEAMVCYAQAQAIEDTPDVRYNIGICQLQLANLPAGFAGYEWRWEANTKLKKSQRTFTQPQWTGAESAAGKTVLLYGEQGYGDTLQMCRFVKDVAARGAHVILNPQAGMQHLLADTEGASVVIDARAELPPFDYHCSLMSVALALGVTIDTIPAVVPYVRSQPARVARWLEQLGTANKPRIGLAWSGNPDHRNDKNRSLSLGTLLPLLTDDYEWISLQKDVRGDDEALLHNSPILHIGEQFRNYTDTAALVELLDLVISVDTSIAHLAGAMGKPVWVVLPYNPDWRWLLHRDDSPWYPTARLFRQPVRGDWDGAIETMRTELVRTLSRAPA